MVRYSLAKPGSTSNTSNFHVMFVMTQDDTFFFSCKNIDRIFKRDMIVNQNTKNMDHAASDAHCIK